MKQWVSIQVWTIFAKDESYLIHNYASYEKLTVWPLEALYQPLAMRTLSDSTSMLDVVDSFGEEGGGGGDEPSWYPELALP